MDNIPGKSVKCEEETKEPEKATIEASKKVEKPSKESDNVTTSGKDNENTVDNTDNLIKKMLKMLIKLFSYSKMIRFQMLF